MSRLEHTPRRSTVGCGAAVARPPKPERDGTGGGLLRRRSRRPLCLFEVAEQHRERHRAAATGYRTPVEGDLGRVLAVERDDDEFSSNGTPAHSTHRCYPNRDVRGAIPTCARRSRRPTATATHRCRDRTARWEGLYSTSIPDTRRPNEVRRVGSLLRRHGRIRRDQPLSRDGMSYSGRTDAENTRAGS